MQLLEKPREMSLTTKGCRLCKFWKEYLGEEGEEMKANLGLVGHGWGRCSNSVNNILSAAELDSKQVEAIHNSKTSYKKYPVIGTVVSTLDTFECSNFKANTEK